MRSSSEQEDRQAKHAKPEQNDKDNSPKQSDESLSTRNLEKSKRHATSTITNPTQKRKVTQATNLRFGQSTSILMALDTNKAAKFAMQPEGILKNSAPNRKSASCIAAVIKENEYINDEIRLNRNQRRKSAAPILMGLRSTSRNPYYNKYNDESGNNTKDIRKHKDFSKETSSENKELQILKTEKFLHDPVTSKASQMTFGLSTLIVSGKEKTRPKDKSRRQNNHTKLSKSELLPLGSEVARTAKSKRKYSLFENDNECEAPEGNHDIVEPADSEVTFKENFSIKPKTKVSQQSSNDSGETSGRSTKKRRTESEGTFNKKSIVMDILGQISCSNGVILCDKSKSFISRQDKKRENSKNSMDNESILKTVDFESINNFYNNRRKMYRSPQCPEAHKSKISLTSPISDFASIILSPDQIAHNRRALRQIRCAALQEVPKHLISQVRDSNINFLSPENLQKSLQKMSKLISLPSRRERAIDAHESDKACDATWDGELSSHSSDYLSEVPFLSQETIEDHSTETYVKGETFNEEKAIDNDQQLSSIEQYKMKLRPRRAKIDGSKASDQGLGDHILVESKLKKMNAKDNTRRRMRGYANSTIENIPSDKNPRYPDEFGSKFKTKDIIVDNVDILSVIREVDRGLAQGFRMLLNAKNESHDHDSVPRSSPSLAQNSEIHGSIPTDCNPSEVDDECQNPLVDFETQLLLSSASEIIARPIPVKIESDVQKIYSTIPNEVALPLNQPKKLGKGASSMDAYQPSLGKSCDQANQIQQQAKQSPVTILRPDFFRLVVVSTPTSFKHGDSKVVFDVVEAERIIQKFPKENSECLMDDQKSGKTKCLIYGEQYKKKDRPLRVSFGEVVVQEIPSHKESHTRNCELVDYAKCCHQKEAGTVIPQKVCNNWNQSDIAYLREAVAVTSPTSSCFWETVAALIGRHADDCRTQWFELLKTPNGKKGKMTPKGRDTEEENGNDDIFQSTPYRLSDHGGEIHSWLTLNAPDGISSTPIKNSGRKFVGKYQEESPDSCFDHIRDSPLMKRTGYKTYIKGLTQEQKMTKSKRQKRVIKSVVDVDSRIKALDKVIVIDEQMDAGGSLNLKGYKVDLQFRIDSDLEDMGIDPETDDLSDSSELVR